MTKTEHLQLNQWASEDRVSRAEFNENFAALDQNAAEQAEAINAAADLAQAAADFIGGSANCRIAVGSYTGSGTYGKTNPVQLTFAFTPRFLVIGSKENSYQKFDKLMYPHPYGVMGNEGTAANLTWGTNSISWYNTDSAARQLNVSGTKYYYVAFGNADA